MPRLREIDAACPQPLSITLGRDQGEGATTMTAAAHTHEPSPPTSSTAPQQIPRGEQNKPLRSKPIHGCYWL